MSKVINTSRSNKGHKSSTHSNINLCDCCAVVLVIEAGCLRLNYGITLTNPRPDWPWDSGNVVRVESESELGRLCPRFMERPSLVPRWWLQGGFGRLCTRFMTRPSVVPGRGSFGLEQSGRTCTGSASAISSALRSKCIFVVWRCTTTLNLCCDANRHMSYHGH